MSIVSAPCKRAITSLAAVTRLGSQRTGQYIRHLFHRALSTMSPLRHSQLRRFYSTSRPPLTVGIRCVLHCVVPSCTMLTGTHLAVKIRRGYGNVGLLLHQKTSTISSRIRKSMSTSNLVIDVSSLLLNMPRSVLQRGQGTNVTTRSLYYILVERFC